MHQIVADGKVASRCREPLELRRTTARQTVSSFRHNLFLFCGRSIRPNRTQWFPKTNAGSTTVLRDELDAGLFESASNILKGTRIWLPYSTLEVRNSFRGCFACLWKIRLRPPKEAARTSALLPA